MRGPVWNRGWVSAGSDRGGTGVGAAPAGQTERDGVRDGVEDGVLAGTAGALEEAGDAAELLTPDQAGEVEQRGRGVTSHTPSPEEPEHDHHHGDQQDGPEGDGSQPSAPLRTRRTRIVQGLALHRRGRHGAAWHRTGQPPKRRNRAWSLPRSARDVELEGQVFIWRGVTQDGERLAQQIAQLGGALKFALPDPL